MTRTIVFVVGLFILGATATAHAVPQSIGFGGRLTDLQGDPVQGPVPVTFEFFAADTGGTALWSEVHPAVTPDEDGLLFATLGDITPLVRAGGSPLFNGEIVWLEVTVDTDVLGPRLPVHSVPYALQAGHADTADVATMSESASTAAALGSNLPAQVVNNVKAGAPVAVTRTANSVDVRLNACANNQILKIVNGQWQCTTDSNTTYTAMSGSGIIVNAAAATIGSDQGVLQRRAPGGPACSTGYLRDILVDGTPSCSRPACRRVVASSSSGGVDAFCAVGETLTGGGCLGGNNGQLTESYPVTDLTWHCVRQLVGPISAFAICCKM
jgi:hypothetical protein